MREQEDPPYKYVSVEGALEIVELDAAASRAFVEPMAVRYLDEELGRGYASSSVGPDDILIRLRPDRWFSVDFAKPG